MVCAAGRFGARSEDDEAEAGIKKPVRRCLSVALVGVGEALRAP